MHALGFHHEQVIVDLNSLNFTTQFDLFILRICSLEPTETALLKSTLLSYQASKTSTTKKQAKRTPPLMTTNLSCIIPDQQECKL